MHICGKDAPRQELDPVVLDRRCQKNTKMYRFTCEISRNLIFPLAPKLGTAHPPQAHPLDTPALHIAWGFGPSIVCPQNKFRLMPLVCMLYCEV